MNTKEKHSSTRSNVGKKAEASANRKPLFTLKTKCRQLTVGDYIRLVCEDDFVVLVLTGNPDRDALNEAKMAVFSEFAELSGAGESEAGRVFKEITKYREDIFAITTALNMFGSYFDDEIQGRAFTVLERCGIRTKTWTPQTLESDIKRAVNVLKSKELRMRHEIERYNKLSARNEGEKVTEKDIRLEMAVLGSNLHCGISDECNLATYAGYKHANKKQAEAAEDAMQKSKSKK